MIGREEVFREGQARSKRDSNCGNIQPMMRTFNTGRLLSLHSFQAVRRRPWHDCNPFGSLRVVPDSLLYYSPPIRPQADYSKVQWSSSGLTCGRRTYMCLEALEERILPMYQLRITIS